MTVPAPLLHIALHEPQIPQNTGNIGRLSLGFGARLHLVGRLGFRTDERACRRAGLDYWKHVDRVEHADLAALRAALPEGSKIVCFSTRAERSFTDVRYEIGDCLLFGGEVRGLPQDELDAAGALAVRIPLRSTKVRSLNLANAVAIGAAEVLRQLGYPETIPPRPALSREQGCTQS
jgi:tRNA (cytidine/uridine-2'-O-)-methyltransferase